MMVDKLIEDGSLRATAGGFSVNVRLPWYRSLPLSTVELISLALDGRPVALEQIMLGVNGQRWPLTRLPDLTREFWFVTDSAELQVTGERLSAGSEYDIEVVLALYPPYIRGLQRLLRWTKRLQAH